IKIHGDDLNNISFSNKLVGYLIEEPKLYDYLTGKEHLQIIQRLNGTVDSDYLDYLTNGLKMSEYLNKKIKNYSLGMRQRLGIASSMVHKPDIIILDEPLNTLDIEGVKLLKDLIREQKEMKKGIL
ncbi:ATP-binding cassette domain-containing protein, partial [Bacillus sp. MM2020_1]|nr:ATP-binding cassette domain-containing protein [Bacillus sp. MM2020_1]